MKDMELLSRLTLRPEREEEYSQVEELTREAFWNQYGPGCDEHYLVHIMRTCPEFVPELDTVAELDGQCIGNIQYTRARLILDAGGEREVLCFGPLSVLPQYQSRGIGARLIDHTAAKARELGFNAILITGDPEYYKRVGFLPAERYGIANAEDQYMDALLARELTVGALTGCAGRFVEAPVFALDAGAAAAFDENFAAREKYSGLPSQLRFQTLSAASRPRK